LKELLQKYFYLPHQMFQLVLKIKHQQHKQVSLTKADLAFF